jgi:hypothetical protein
MENTMNTRISDLALDLGEYALDIEFENREDCTQLERLAA